MSRDYPSPSEIESQNLNPASYILRAPTLREASSPERHMTLPLLTLARTTTAAATTTTTTRLVLLHLRTRTPHTSSTLRQLRPFGASRARHLGGFRTVQQAKSRYRSGPFSWKAGLLFLLTGGFLIGYFRHERARAERERIAAAGKAGVGVGKPRIGGPFVLTDMFGKRVTEEEFKERYTLVYFGFTNCPDICPEELDKLAAMIDLVNKKCGNVITPIFITCDPARDTPEALREYLSEFHPKIIGLTGSYDEIKSVCKAYRVYFSTPPAVKPGQDYLVDHSIYFYLMDPEGDFVEALGRQHTSQEAADLIMKYIKDWEGPLRTDDRALYAPAVETPPSTSVISNTR